MVKKNASRNIMPTPIVLWAITFPIKESERVIYPIIAIIFTTSLIESILTSTNVQNDCLVQIYTQTKSMIIERQSRRLQTKEALIL